MRSLRNKLRRRTLRQCQCQCCPRRMILFGKSDSIFALSWAYMCPQYRLLFLGTRLAHAQSSKDGLPTAGCNLTTFVAPRSRRHGSPWTPPSEPPGKKKKKKCLDAGSGVRAPRSLAELKAWTLGSTAACRLPFCFGLVTGALSDPFISLSVMHASTSSSSLQSTVAGLAGRDTDAEQFPATW